MAVSPINVKVAVESSLLFARCDSGDAVMILMMATNMLTNVLSVRVLVLHHVPVIYGP